MVGGPVDGRSGPRRNLLRRQRNRSAVDTASASRRGIPPWNHSCLGGDTVGRAVRDRRRRPAGFRSRCLAQSVTDDPPAAEWSRPNRRVGRRVLYYDELPSAMTTATALGEPGVAVLAGEQTAGRGQY